MAILTGHGILITTSSEVANSNVPYMSAYCASKAAITKAIHVLNIELQPKGILSYAVHPGSVKTSLGGGESVNQAAIKAVPGMQQFWDYIPQLLVDSPELAAHTMVALAADDRAKVLSGRFVDSTQDLGEVLERVDELKERNLYEVHINKL